MIVLNKKENDEESLSLLGWVVPATIMEIEWRLLLGTVSFLWGPESSSFILTARIFTYPPFLVLFVIQVEDSSDGSGSGGHVRTATLRRVRGRPGPRSRGLRQDSHR